MTPVMFICNDCKKEYRKLRHIKRHLKKSGHSGYTTQVAKTL